MLTSKDEELDKLRGRKTNKSSPDTDKFQSIDIEGGYDGSASSLIKKHVDIEREKLRETLNIDYIKNVFIKYLEYLANNNEKEAMTLEKVLFTVLKTDEKDIEVIEKARQKNTGGILSYFYSSGYNATVPRPVYPRMHDSGGQQHSNGNSTK